eukprot:scaffold5024_cov136-Cylindrotheca_fusiformis.AAC.34
MTNSTEERKSGMPPPNSAFSMGGPNAPDSEPEDPDPMENNDLTSSLLRPSGEAETLFGSSSQIAAAVSNPHSSLRLLARKIGNLLLTITLLTMIVVIPVVTVRQVRKHKIEIAASQSAAVLVAGTLVLSVRLVYLHFMHWYMPSVQKYVVRIIWMVPIYSIQSWLSLEFRNSRIYIDAVRDLYEAFVIASFVYYLIELLGGQDELVRTLRLKARNDPATAAHLGDHGYFLNHVLEPWELGVEFMLQCKHGVLQYVVAKTVATVLTFVCQWLDIYGEGEFRWNVTYPYLAFLLNISVMYALYCLVKLFYAVKDDLRYPIDWHPLGKFLCVKGAHGIIVDAGNWTGEQVANGLIDYCVCIEMVGFAIAHSYTFTYTEYLPSTVRQAVDDYQQSLQEQQHDEEDNNDSNHATNRSASYRPPDTLPTPMRFRDALISSTLPSETIRDIRRLRNGVEQAVGDASNPGSISLQDVLASELDQN